MHLFAEFAMHAPPLVAIATVPPRGNQECANEVYCTSQQILDTNHKKIYNKNSLLVRYPFVMQLAILSWRQIV